MKTDRDASGLTTGGQSVCVRSWQQVDVRNLDTQTAFLSLRASLDSVTDSWVSSVNHFRKKMSVTTLLVG